MLRLTTMLAAEPMLVIDCAPDTFCLPDCTDDLRNFARKADDGDRIPGPLSLSNLPSMLLAWLPPQLACPGYLPPEPCFRRPSGSMSSAAMLLLMPG